MVGSIVIVGEGWGKIRFQNRFAPFWKLFVYFLLEIVAYVALTDMATDYIEGILLANSQCLLGITSGVLGTFFLWFVYSFDFDIRTDKKWVFPLVCYGIAVLNFSNYI